MNNLKKTATNIIEPLLKKGAVTPMAKKTEAAKTLQAAIKRKKPSELLARQIETGLVNQYEAIDKSVPAIQAAIKRKLVKKPTEELLTGKKNVYPQAPVYKIDKLREAIRSIMENLPEAKGKIKLNASKSNMIKFLEEYKYPLEEAVSGFKPIEKRSKGRPKLVKISSI